MNPKKRVTVHLEPDQYAALEKIAGERRISISAVMRQAADLLIAEHTRINHSTFTPMGQLLRQVALESLAKEELHDRPATEPTGVS